MQGIIGREDVEVVFGVEQVAKYFFIGMTPDIFHVESGLDFPAERSAFYHFQVEEPPIAVGDEIPAVPSFDDRRYAINTACRGFEPGCPHGFFETFAFFFPYLSRLAIDKFDAVFSDTEKIIGQGYTQPFGFGLE